MPVDRTPSTSSLGDVTKLTTTAPGSEAYLKFSRFNYPESGERNYIIWSYGPSDSDEWIFTDEEMEGLFYAWLTAREEYDDGSN